MKVIFDSSLVLCLPLQETDGSSFVSRDAFGHAGTVTGARWKSHGRYFDGGDDKIVIPDSPSLDITGDITIEAWFRPASVGKYHTLVSKGADIAYNFRVRDNNKVQFYITEADSDLKQVTTDESVVAGRWQHIAGTGSPLRVYLDGLLAKEGEGYTDIETTATVLSIGSRAGDWAPGFLHGDIGEIRIYRRALSGSEIQQNYLATRWRYQ